MDIVIEMVSYMQNLHMIIDVCDKLAGISQTIISLERFHQLVHLHNLLLSGIISG
jgi:hypothetical protein